LKNIHKSISSYKGIPTQESHNLIFFLLAQHQQTAKLMHINGDTGGLGHKKTPVHRVYFLTYYHAPSINTL